MGDGLMEELCSCGHTLRYHPMYLSCDAEGCKCPGFTPIPWWAEQIAVCICELPVYRNDPRKGIRHAERDVIVHLDCAPA